MVREYNEIDKELIIEYKNGNESVLDDIINSSISLIMYVIDYYKFDLDSKLMFEKSVEAVKDAVEAFDINKKKKFNEFACSYVLTVLKDMYRQNKYESCGRKLLTNDEFNTLFKEYKNGNKEARKEIANHNIGLIFYVIHHYNFSMNYEEMFEDGYVSLFKAVDTYKPGKGTFATYARSIIFNGLKMLYRKKHSLNNFEKKIASLDKKISDDDTLGDIVSSNIRVEDNIEKKELMIELYDILNYLPELELNVIRYTYGLNCKPLTQNEIASKYNIQQKKVSDIHKKVLKDIKAKLIKKDLYEVKEERVMDKEFVYFMANSMINENLTFPRLENRFNIGNSKIRGLFKKYLDDDTKEKVKQIVSSHKY